MIYRDDSMRDDNMWSGRWQWRSLIFDRDLHLVIFAIGRRSLHSFDIHQSDHTPVIIWDPFYLFAYWLGWWCELIMIIPQSPVIIIGTLFLRMLMIENQPRRSCGSILAVEDIFRPRKGKERIFDGRGEGKEVRIQDIGTSQDGFWLLEPP